MKALFSSKPKAHIPNIFRKLYTQVTLPNAIIEESVLVGKF